MYCKFVNGPYKTLNISTLYFGFIFLISSHCSYAQRVIAEPANSLTLISQLTQFEKQIGPNEKYVIHRLNNADRNVAGIFSSPIDGSSPAVRLNSPLPLGGLITFDFKISPDGRFVVYRANQNESTAQELFSVPIDGSSAPVRLNNPLTDRGDVLAFEISPDSNLVVYKADEITAGINNLFVVPVDGSSDASRIDPDVFTIVGDTTEVIDAGVPIPTDNPNVNTFKITPDGQNVVYMTAQTAGFAIELFRVSINGGSRQRLNGDLVGPDTPDREANNPGGDVIDFKISNNGQRVSYLADQITDGQFELFTTTINGNNPSLLNSDLIGGGDVTDFIVSEDSQYVVYQADQNTNLSLIHI